MNIPHPTLEILKCIEIINQPKEKFYKDDDKIFNLNNTTDMKKKIKITQGTFGETIETEELVEETFDDAKPFEIDEITKIDDSNIQKVENNTKKKKPLLLITEINKSSHQKMNKKYAEVLEEELKLMTKITNENKDQLEKYKNLNSTLNAQVANLKELSSKLKENNTQLKNDLNTVAKELSGHTDDKVLQTKLDLIYKQQNIIKDYEDQISKLKKENQLLEQNTELPPSWLTGDLKFGHESNNDTEKVSEQLNQKKYDEELKGKLKFIYEQQNIIKDYEDQISKLKKENQSLAKNSEQVIHQEDYKDEIKDIKGKIKHYQDDNLRLSNELVVLSNKLENTKAQLKYFENNKSRLMSQLESLNNIISESNVVQSPFNDSVSKIDKTSEKIDKKISEEGEEKVKKISLTQQQFIIQPKKMENPEEMNRQTVEIFKK